MRRLRVCRRAGALAAVAALAAVTVAAAPASAAEETASPPVPFGEAPPRDYHSPQHFALEFKFGPYSPNIDASKGLRAGTHPFVDLFPHDPGKSRPPGRLLTSLEFDYQFLHRWGGSFGIGHSIGYYRRTTHAFQYNNGMTSCTVGDMGNNGCVRSGDITALNIIPLELLAVYRFDYLATRWHIPLVPYFKVGLAYYIWWIENGGGAFSVSKSLDGKSGYGGSFGWVLNPGGAFLLDVLEPSVARSMDAELGINHTYLFVELHYADVSGFGASNKMTLSDIAVNAGLSFEF